MEFDTKQSAGSVAPQSSSHGKAPGKKTLTRDLPPKKEPRHHEMTGIEALDNDASQDGGERFFLEPFQRLELRRIVQGGILVWLSSVMAALNNTKLAKATKNDHFWNGFMEILFLSVTGPFIGPIAGALARNINKLSMPLAEVGLHKAAWAAAVDSNDLIGPVTIALKGVRGQLAHSNNRPKDLNAQMAFLSSLQGHMGPAAMTMIEEISQFSGDAELIAYYWALKDPAVMDVGAHEAHISRLLDMFESNRLGSIGNEMEIGGGYKVAEPKWVQFRNQKFMVLLESAGVRQSALALNGANMDESKPKMTMESLTYVKMVERPMWSLVTQEYKDKNRAFFGPEKEIETLNFNNRSERSQHRWAEDWYRDVKGLKGKTDEVANTVGAEDPFDFNYGLTGADS